MREKFLEKIFRILSGSKIKILYDKNGKKYALFNTILMDLDNEKILDYDYKCAKKGEAE